jgi:hypothetical protein
MSTKAGTVGISARPTLFTLWTAAVSVLAVTAVILSAVALSLAVRAMSARPCRHREKRPPLIPSSPGPVRD